MPIGDDYTCNLGTYRRVRWMAWVLVVTGAIVTLAAQITNITELRAVGLTLLISVLVFLQLWSPTIQMANLPILRDVRSVITLVHGTWGLTSRWIRADSDFNKKLQSSLGDGVLCTPFYWTGRNTAGARQRAAAELTRHLVRVASLYPGASHFLVAHSHGGNICMYAIRDLPRDSMIAGVACMSTPFICAQMRDLGSGGPHLLSSVISTPAVILIALLSWLIWRTAGLHLAWWMLALVPIYMFAIGICVLESSISVDSWARRAIQRGIEIDAAPKEGVNLLILRTLGDEASAALALAQIGNIVLHHAWTVPSSLVTMFHELLNRLFESWNPDSTKASNFVGRLLTEVLVAAYYAILLIPPVLFWAPIMVAWILGACALHVAGIGHGRISPIIEVTAEPTPKGTWELHTFSGRELGLPGKLFGHHLPLDWVSSSNATLAHSTAYDDPRCIDLVANWIKTYGANHPSEVRRSCL